MGTGFMQSDGYFCGNIDIRHTFPIIEYKEAL
jgi:hypothetical protein